MTGAPCAFPARSGSGAGRVLSKVTLHRACMVEFMINRQTVVARVDDHDLVEVRPNARV
jgi:hypothetical protein